MTRQENRQVLDILTSIEATGGLVCAEMHRQCAAAIATLDAELAKPEAKQLAQFESPEVQAVYEILCNEGPSDPAEHWEGFIARRIVHALASKPKESAE